MRTVLLIGKIILACIILIFLYFFASVGYSYFLDRDNIIFGQTEGSEFIGVDNKKIAYRETLPIGTKNGDVLLIHGFAAWGKTWLAQEEYFSKKGYRVITLDIPPFGFSDEYDSSYFSREKQAYLIQESIRLLHMKNIILVAHSYGGKAAMETYMNQPNIFSGMILLDVALGFPKETQEFTPPKGIMGYIMTHDTLRNMLMRFVMTNTFIGKKGLQSFLYDPASLSEERLDIYKKPFTLKDKGEYLGDWMSYVSLHEETGKSTREENYSSIKIPVLIVWGKNDTITPLNQGNKLHSMIISSDLVILENVNHIPQIEKPIELHQAIDDFLAKNFSSL